MAEIVLQFDHVWKRFKKGELSHDSLRDLIPDIGKKMFSKKSKDKLQEREFWAVKDVSFDVKAGEALGIIGPNGAGKSTILKLLSKILKPNRGNIVVHGRLSALIEIGAGFHPDLTGRENIYLNGAILGMKKDEINRKLDDIIEFSGLMDFIDTPVKRYSSGMYARLGFSVAAHVDPEILLVDEVLSVGDFTFQHKCIRKMNEIVRSGTTVIFISHNIPSVMDLCPNAILLNKGEIERYGNSKEVCRYYYSSNAIANAKGNNTIKVKNALLYSDSDNLANTFTPGEWGYMKVHVESADRIENLFMGFLVKKNDGEMVFDANSDKISEQYYSFKEGETKEIEVRFRANLPAGTYFIGIHFMDSLNKYYYFDDELLELTVNAPITLGNAYMDLQWRASKEMKVIS
jgi:lipopolysaccharide transport system ATP-binding protein